MRRVSVAIVEASELKRQGLLKILESAGKTIETVEVFDDIQDCDVYLKDHAVVLIMVTEPPSPTRGFYSTLRRWASIEPQPRVIVFSENLSAASVEHLFEIGVLGYIFRDDCNRATILACIESAIARRPFVSPYASAEFYRRRAFAKARNLSQLDVDVIHFMGEGLTTQEIATVLNYNVGSIYRSKRNLRLSLGVKTNDQLVDAARRNGMLSP